MWTDQDTNETVEMVKKSPTALAMIAMSILSNAQEMMGMGNSEDANYMMNQAKVIIDEFLAKKDEHGRIIE